MSLGIPKPRPRLLDKREVKAGVTDVDKKERAKCRVRSKGQCEVLVNSSTCRGLSWRCSSRATENHHLLGGVRYERVK